METGIPEPQSQLSAEKDILDRAANRWELRQVGKLCTTLTIRIGKTREAAFFCRILAGNIPNEMPWHSIAQVF